MSDVDDLLLALVRAAAPDAQVSPDQPAALLDRLPYVVARRVAGAWTAAGEVDSATCDVQVYAPTRRDASVLAHTIRTGLHAAWTDQTVTAHGHLCFLREVSAPAELRDSEQPGGVWRYQATYSLGVRPG